jgi:2',3'-cyclic-nucleotide 2'-phosphodiesterase (5'-nucleotidase family)
MSFGVIFDFKGNSNVSRITNAKDMVLEQWFIQAINYTEPIDLFVVIGHNPVRRSDRQCTLGYVYDAIRKLNPDTPIQIFGGHTHIRDFVVYDDRATGLEAGT